MTGCSPQASRWPGHGRDLARAFDHDLALVAAEHEIGAMRLLVQTESTAYIVSREPLTDGDVEQHAEAIADGFYGDEPR